MAATPQTPPGARPAAGRLSRDSKTRLKKVRILVADQDERVATLVYTTLRSFGFDQIEVVSDGAQLLQSLREKDVDLLISEWDLKVVDGIKLIQTIRRDSGQRWQRDLPAIILTGKADLESVRQARDAGFTEFVAKPFSARSLSTRLLQMIDNPRNFVISPQFVGPCRRRRNIPDFKAEHDRRGRDPQFLGRERPVGTLSEIDHASKEKPTGTLTGIDHVAAEKATGTLSAIENAPKSTGGLIEILPPNRRLSQIIGEDTSGSSIFTDKMISNAQIDLQKQEKQFIAWAEDDIRILEANYTKLKDDHKNDEAKERLLAAAYSLKSQAGIFGFDMGTEVARMLLDYMPPEKPVNDTTLIVLRKFLDTIAVVFKNKVKEGGGEIGAALVKGLQILMRKLG